TMERQLDSLWRRMEEAPDVYAGVSFSPVQLFKDVHAKLQLSPSQSMEGIKAIKFFPFPVLIKENRIFVNVQGEAIPYLSEIKAINGQSAESIIADLTNAAYSDGYISTGTDRVFRSFQISFSWNNSAVDTYRIDYTAPGE